MDVITRAKEVGVEKMICVGTNLEDSQEAIEIANKFEGVYASVGIHPEGTCDDWEKFEELISKPKVVAIGECGLDYKVGLPGQEGVFQKQIGIAKKLNLPLIIHCRDAQEDMSKIDLTANRGVLHCFAGGINIPDNFYVSFAGNVTFKNAPNLREVAKAIPLEKLLLETDSPLLAPEPLRGSKNSPKNVKIIASLLSELKGVPVEELEKITSENAARLFGI